MWLLGLGTVATNAMTLLLVQTRKQYSTSKDCSFPSHCLEVLSDCFPSLSLRISQPRPGLSPKVSCIMHCGLFIKRQYYLLANLPQLSSRSGRNHTNGCRGIRLAQINISALPYVNRGALSPADRPSRPLLAAEPDGLMARDNYLF